MNLRHPRDLYPRMAGAVRRDRSDVEYRRRRQAERRNAVFTTLLLVGALVIAVALVRLFLNR